MKTIAAMYQALIEGKTLVDKDGSTITLKNTYLYHPEDWEVESIYEWQWIGKPTATSDSFSITSKYYAEGEFVPELHYFTERYEPSKRKRV